MIIFLEEHKQILRSLIDGGVDFILVGGYAVNYHGYNRPTGDMDILLKPDNNNKEKLLAMFKKEGFSDKSLKNVAKLDFTKPAVFHIGTPPKRIDFLTRISRIDFDDAWKEKQILSMEQYKIPVIQLHHLILTKLGTGRDRDKGDVDELQRIERLKKKSK
ncbi:MAG TPA: nucleotidyltransferase [Bacteroidia bacterium]|nr:nucleotidyltransferase [Bacteroidia bacterium]